MLLLQEDSNKAPWVEAQVYSQQVYIETLLILVIIRAS